MCRDRADSFQIEAPLSAADVRNPLRRLWPAKEAGFKPDTPRVALHDPRRNVVRQGVV